MGIRENFAQAVKELTGGKSDDKAADKRAAGVESLRKAVDDESGVSKAVDFTQKIDDDVSFRPQQAETVKTPEIEDTTKYYQQTAPAMAPYGAAYQNNANTQPQIPEPPQVITPGNVNAVNANAAGLATGLNNSDNVNNNSTFGGVNPQQYSQPQPQTATYGAATANRSPEQPSGLFQVPNTQQNQQQSFSPVRPSYSEEEITVISKNTVVDGNIRSFANMMIDGDIKGDIETTKNIDLNGKVIGNLICNNAEMHNSQVQGNIRLKGNVVMERDTLLIGDLVSTYAKINGKIKGNLDISGKAEFKGDSVIFGDISASTITVGDGAIIQGYVSTTFLSKEESVNIFPETISIGE